MHLHLDGNSSTPEHGSCRGRRRAWTGSGWAITVQGRYRSKRSGICETARPRTEVLALAPEESEKAVTIPLEMERAGIQGVQEMRSLTKFGLSQVTLIFKDGMDIYRARQLVAEGADIIDIGGESTRPDSARVEASEEIRMVIQVLSRRTKNNPVLIGDPGVGKTALAEGLAERIVAGDVPETLKDKKVVALDHGSPHCRGKVQG